MAENGYGSGPVTGHIGRIPNYGKTQVNPMGSVEPPACIQNAMMTKDKKPFTYTPGGLDLSQIRTPSMARKMARQRSWEENEQAYGQQQQANGGGHYNPQGGPAPPPPPPSQVPAPPPPPPLVIEVPNSKCPNPKPVVPGIRPEIVIPDSPIKMLRKTNSPYHWEAEKAELARIGPVPKFVEKVPSPLTVQMPPSTFSQQPPQNYTPQQNSFQQNNSYGNQNYRAPESPLHRPEAQYAKAAPPNVQSITPTRDLLQRQDSQFNKSPQPFAGQPQVNNGSPFSPTPNNNWKQPERRDSPAHNLSNSPQTPPFNRGTFASNSQQPNYQTQSPQANSGFYTLPRANQRNQENYSSPPQNNNAIYNNQQAGPQSPKVDTSNPAPWRTNTLNRYPKENQQTVYQNQNANQQPAYNQTWKQDNQFKNQPNPQYSQPNQQQQYSPLWAREQEVNNNKFQENYRPSWPQERAVPVTPPSKQEQPRYQSKMSIPVTPRQPQQPPQPAYNNTQPQKEAVYVNQEPIYYRPESPKSIPPWVKTQKEKTKTPPPAWVQKPLEGRKSAPRELVTPPRETEPEWVRKSNEIQRTAREVVSPPKYQQQVQPTWSTRPSENRKSLPRDNAPNIQGNRTIPVQVDSSNERYGNQPPQFKVDMQNPNAQGQQRYQAPLSQPTQRIMRVLSPQLVRLDDGPKQPELPSLNKNFHNNQDNQPKTRIIPIQIEGGNSGANKRVYYHKFTQEAPPRQSKAFKVLQIITRTEDSDSIQDIENQHGYTDV